MDGMVALGFFLFVLGFGFFLGRRIGLERAQYLADRVRELEKREASLMRTILRLRREGFVEEVEPEPLEPAYLIDDEFGADVAEERAGRSRHHEEMVSEIIDED